MIEAGTVKKRLEGGKVLVSFEHLGMEAECEVLQPTTGKNTVFRLPCVGTQVVCSLEAGKNFALGAVFSDEEPVPQDADPDGYRAEIAGVTVDFTDGKAGLKNGSTDFKTILNDILNTIRNITVSTSMGPSGTPLPPTLQAIEQLSEKVDNLFK